MKNYYKNIVQDELILLAQKGNKEATKELLRREEKNIISYLRYLKVDNEEIPDIVQEILMKLSKNIEKLKSPANFKGWLKQIITNQFYDSLRKKQRELKKLDTENETADIAQIPDYSTNPFLKAQNKELDKKIKLAIKKLPTDFKKAIIMRELKGLSYEEIAKKTNSSVGTVKSRISRAREKLKCYLKPYLCEN